MPSQTSIESKYIKLTQHQHILHRPDSYVGSVQMDEQTMWVFDETLQKLRFKSINFVPAMYKIFDEIIVNAADNKVRDPRMNKLEVVINTEENFISILNNGASIPIEFHSKEQCYLPEMILGRLLTSSNYNDNEKKITGGRNGYGAKLTNIFSKKFIIECRDVSQEKSYMQIFSQNMSKKTEPVIKDYIPSKKADTRKSFTKITFYPDLEKLNMPQGLDKNILSLLKKRVYDIAGLYPGISVSYNGTKLDIETFSDYVGMYFNQDSTTPLVSEIHNRWKIGIALSEIGERQVSFVNSIATVKGGTHVAAISEQIVNWLMVYLKSKYKSLDVKPYQIRNHLWLFVDSKIENPAFSSQTKETLTTPKKHFGSVPVVPEKLLSKLKNSDIVKNIVNTVKSKMDSAMKKGDGVKKIRIAGIPKLDDANKAGSTKSSKCTLILTEGDSAKATALSGLGVVGRDYYGVFPLRGKVLNVREASSSQIGKNAEIQALKQILGLKVSNSYETDQEFKTLRYGSILIMADQDPDGSHIKGLILNLFHYIWPALFRRPGFLREFVTPIVKVFKGSGKKKTQEKWFFTLPEYVQWKQENNDGKGWTTKYYKGLGTSSPSEAKEYFKDLPRHILDFKYIDEADDDAISTVFAKKRISDRKAWLQTWDSNMFVNHSKKFLRYQDFINKELIHFSMDDCLRSIPSVVDGLKPAQRKILYICLGRKKNAEMKVAQLAAFVAQKTAYHHGESSLALTIVGMAQNFVGSNNINLLDPVGMFGTRINGGKDASSPRYIFTRLTSIAKSLFPIADEPLLHYLVDDGLEIEPLFYCPIVPLALINGTNGIGSGYSTRIAQYNPRDIIQIVKDMISISSTTNSTDFSSIGFDNLIPWNRGYNGDIIPTIGKSNQFTYKGIYRKADELTYEILELPVGTWTQNYKEFLEEKLCLTKSELQKAQSGNDWYLKDVTQHHTDQTIHFKLYFHDEEAIARFESKNIEKELKLSVKKSNVLVLFNPASQISTYSTIGQIFVEYFTTRLSMYHDRKMYLMGEMTAEMEEIQERINFITGVIEETISIKRVKRQQLIDQLKSLGFSPIPPTKAFKQRFEKERRDKFGDVSLDASVLGGDSDDEDEDDQESLKGEPFEKYNAKTMKVGGQFAYLRRMPLDSLTWERIDSLNAQLRDIQGKIELLISKSKQQLWLDELEVFEQQLSLFESDFNDAVSVDPKVVKNAMIARENQRKLHLDKIAAKNEMNGMQKAPIQSAVKKRKAPTLGNQKRKTSPQKKQRTNPPKQSTKSTKATKPIKATKNLDSFQESFEETFEESIEEWTPSDDESFVQPDSNDEQEEEWDQVSQSDDDDFAPLLPRLKSAPKKSSKTTRTRKRAPVDENDDNNDQDSYEKESFLEKSSFTDDDDSILKNLSQEIIDSDQDSEFIPDSPSPKKKRSRSLKKPSKPIVPPKTLTLSKKGGKRGKATTQKTTQKVAQSVPSKKPTKSTTKSTKSTTKGGKPRKTTKKKSPPSSSPPPKMKKTRSKGPLQSIQDIAPFAQPVSDEWNPWDFM